MKTLNLLRKAALTLFISLLILGLQAREIPVEEIRIAAQTFIDARLSGQSIDSISSLIDSDSVIIGYVVILNPEGYITFSNNSDIYPVISYSESGQFDFIDSHDNVLLHLVKWDLEARNESLRTKPLGDTKGLSENKAEWNRLLTGSVTKAAPEEYGPLLETDWHQSSYFNNKCPIDPDSSERSVVGCVATAASQILYYWRYPSSMYFYPHERYNSKGYNGEISIPADASSQDFPSFSQLNSSLANINYDFSESEIANLCFGTGIKYKMHYSSDGSFAIHRPEFYQNIGFGSALKGSWSDCSENVLKNIKDGWPVQVGVHNFELDNHHSVVFDGYKSDGAFHINMGWSNYERFNTWYYPPNLTPTSYNFIGKVVYDICPVLGWSQWGGDAKNSHRSFYKLPVQNMSWKWHRTSNSDYRFYCLVIGVGGDVIATTRKQGSSSSVWFISPDGIREDEVMLPGETDGLTHPVQTSDGTVYVGSGKGNIYYIDQRTHETELIFSEPDGIEFVEPIKLDDEGNIYACTLYDIYCLNKHGGKKWSYHYPGNSMDTDKVPVIDDENNLVYATYYNFDEKRSYILSFHKETGTIYRQTYVDNLPHDGYRARIPSIDDNGIVYVPCGGNLHIYDPSDNLNLQWIFYPSGGVITNPPTIAKDGTLYVSYWNSNSDLVVAALNIPNRSINWEIPISTNTNDDVHGIYVDDEKNLTFVVNRSGNPDTWKYHCYQDLGDSYRFHWSKDFGTNGGEFAFGPDRTMYIIPIGLGQISAISELDEGESQTAYTNNNPPGEPVYLFPEDGSSDVETTVSFSWSCSDPDGHNLQYSLYLGSEEALDIFEEGITNNSLEVSELNPNTFYTWAVEVTDGQSSTMGPVWSFRTKRTNSPPNNPILLTPEDGSIVTAPFTLSWECTDPDGDQLNYTLYARELSTTDWEFESVGTETSYEIPTWDGEELTYEWYVEASDGEYTSASDIWVFTVSVGEPNSPPDIPTLLTPGNGSTITVPFSLVWSCDDIDGDPLDYILYVREKGTTIWEDVPMGIDTAIEVETWDDESLTLEWYVVASDGEYSSSSETWEFTVSVDESVLLTVDAAATNASIGTGGESDWYRFQTGGPGIYTIQTYGPTDMYMYLYQADQETLIEQDDDDGEGYNSLISRNLLGSTWYYIEVRGYSTSTTGNYSIDVQKESEHPPCGPCTDETFTEASGSLSDNSCDDNYENNADCQKLIQPMGADYVTLTFTAFSVESGYDYVRVYDGPTTSDPLLGSFTGAALPGSVTSSGGTMLVHFTSDFSVTAPGWSAEYTSGEIEPICVSEIFTAQSGIVDDNSGAEDYMNDADCSKLIQPTGVLDITLTFNEFSLENGNDYVRVYDGSTSFDPLLGEFTGTSLPSSVTSTGGSMLIHFTSNSSVTAPGWSASYTSTPPLCGSCMEETFTETTGTLSDNSCEGENYENDADCHKLIQPVGATNITLTFTEFDTEGGYDYVRVYDGPTTSDPLLGAFTGSSTPGSITSSGGSMLVHFTSDFSVTASGWEASYVINTPPCGSCMDLTLTESTGAVSDNSCGSNYENDTDCQKLIQPVGADYVTLTFTEFNIESGYDFVRIYDGTNTGAPLLGEFTGATLPGAISSTGGAMLVHFTSDYSVTAPGWSATYISGTGARASESINEGDMTLDITDKSGKNNGFIIFPNPTSGKFTIELEKGLEEDLILEITDASGKILVQRMIASDGKQMQEEIDFSQKPAGIYFIQLYNKSFRNVGKVVVH